MNGLLPPVLEKGFFAAVDDELFPSSFLSDDEDETAAKGLFEEPPVDEAKGFVVGEVEELPPQLPPNPPLLVPVDDEEAAGAAVVVDDEDDEVVFPAPPILANGFDPPTEEVPNPAKPPVPEDCIQDGLLLF